MPAIWPCDLELRAGGRRLSGSFPYNSTATVADRGRRRKESFAPRAFEFAVKDPAREVNVLAGHDYGKPLASKRAGSLELEDSEDALRFEATLPEEAAQPSWMRDALLAIDAGLIGGISPGFRVPPIDGAETDVPEAGNRGVTIRLIRQAVLHELSLVTRPAYDGTSVALRSDAPGARRRRIWL